MAEPIVPLEVAIFTGQGFINDLLANIISICSMAFMEDEQLKPYQPIRYYNGSPKKKSLDGVPTLHVWCPKVLPDRKSIGGQTGDKLTTHFEYFVSIEYVYSDTDTDDSDIVVNQVAAALYDIINRNLNVNGIVNGTNRVFEILTGDSFYAFSDEQMKLQNKCTIHAVYQRSYKRPTATR